MPAETNTTVKDLVDAANAVHDAAKASLESGVLTQRGGRYFPSRNTLIAA